MTSPLAAHAPSRAKRRLLVAAVGLVLATALWLSIGRLISRVDAVEPADAIYVLGGSRTTRVLEALRLYREGYAPRILLSRGGRDRLDLALERQGVHIPTDGEIQHDILVKGFNVPEAAVIVLDAPVDNTAQEANAVQAMVEAEGWAGLIVVTDRSSSRRTGFAFRRVFGDRLKIMVTCNREDAFNPNRWWADRWSFRATFYEAPKLVAYWFGLRG